MNGSFFTNQVCIFFIDLQTEVPENQLQHLTLIPPEAQQTSQLPQYHVRTLLPSHLLHGGVQPWIFVKALCIISTIKNWEMNHEFVIITFGSVSKEIKKLLEIFLCSTYGPCQPLEIEPWAHHIAFSVPDGSLVKASLLRQPQSGGAHNPSLSVRH